MIGNEEAEYIADAALGRSIRRLMERHPGREIGLLQFKDAAWVKVYKMPDRPLELIKGADSLLQAFDKALNQ